MTTYSERLADQAFNLGSDARLRGLPLKSNPFSFSDASYQAWARGWQHVEAHWGEDVEGRWGYFPLPVVVNYRRPVPIWN